MMRNYYLKKKKKLLKLMFRNMKDVPSLNLANTEVQASRKKTKTDVF